MNCTAYTAIPAATQREPIANKRCPVSPRLLWNVVMAQNVVNNARRIVATINTMWIARRDMVTTG